MLFSLVPSLCVARKIGIGRGIEIGIEINIRAANAIPIPIPIPRPMNRNRVKTCYSAEYTQSAYAYQALSLTAMPLAPFAKGGFLNLTVSFPEKI